MASGMRRGNSVWGSVGLITANSTAAAAKEVPDEVAHQLREAVQRGRNDAGEHENEQK